LPQYAENCILQDEQQMTIKAKFADFYRITFNTQTDKNHSGLLQAIAFAMTL
jgi:hypothetical protein